MVDIISKIFIIESFSGESGFSFKEFVMSITHLMKTVHIPHKSFLDRRSTDSLTAKLSYNRYMLKSEKPFHTRNVKHVTLYLRLSFLIPLDENCTVRCFNSSKKSLMIHFFYFKLCDCQLFLLLRQNSNYLLFHTSITRTISKNSTSSQQTLHIAFM